MSGGGDCHVFTSWLSSQCGGYNEEKVDVKSKSPLFPGPGGAVNILLDCFGGCFTSRSTILHSCPG